MTDIASDIMPITFQRFGRTYQAKITTAKDLLRATDLHEAHWVATGAGIDTLNTDRTFLDYLDTDGNGRVMCFELRDAIGWLFRVLADTAGITERSTELQLDAINISDYEGERIHESASKIAERSGKSQAGSITLDDVRKIKAEIEAMPVSEIGVVLPEASDDPEVQAFLADIITHVGGAPHASGAVGVNQPELDEFLAEADAYLHWHAQCDIPQGQATTDIMPLGDRTPAAAALLRRLRPKVDQYFAQCEAVAFEARVAARVAPNDEQLRSLDLYDPEAIKAFISASPLSQPRADQTLAFDDGLNPLYAGSLGQLWQEVIEPILGGPLTSVSVHQWHTVTRTMAAHEKWLSAKAGQRVEPLGIETLRKYLEPRFAEAAQALIAQRSRSAFVLDNLRLTEKALLYQANLMDLANNFISFPYLYDSERRAMFEMGSLVMDGRVFSLSIRVPHRAGHIKVAESGSACLIYVEVLDPTGKVKYEVAVPATAGGRQNLCVGKRGLFQDIDGSEYDARVVHIIENPINMREALISPFKRLGKLIGGKFEKLTSSAEKEFDTKVSTQMDQATTATPSPATPVAGSTNQAQASGPGAGGLLMGGGVAIAALGSAMAYITKTLSGVAWWQIALTIVGVLLAVMVPAGVAGLIKLRRRDLSAMLEASGWAINARMRLTFKQGRFFTKRPLLPISGMLKRLWPLWAILALILAGAIALGIWKYTTKPDTTPPATQPATTSSPS